MGNIYNFFAESAKKQAHDVALNINDESFTYDHIEHAASRISKCIQKHSVNRFIGLYSNRSKTAFYGILGILKSGNAYVPLNPKFPVERNRLIMQLSDLQVLVIDSVGLDSIEKIIGMQEKQLVLIFPESSPKEIAHLDFSRHVIYTKHDLDKLNTSATEIKTGKYAYMLFTSGSTGVPKGVPISHENVEKYINYLSGRYSDINSSDRFSNTFDLTFDLSVHDMFLCWEKGASLYCIPEESLFAPAKYIKRNRITVWFSVPSLANRMSRLRMLKENSFPDMKYSLFCGEPLSVRLANQWQNASPNSVLENIYGPTEATIGITHYRWYKKDPEHNKHYNEILSIGKIFTSQLYLILDDNKNPVKQNSVGELYLGGEQVTTHYWNNPEKTKDHFIDMFNNGQLWFRTGDLVKEDDEKDIYFVGRKDFQVKIRGYRVELLEIDNIITKKLEIDEVVSVVHPIVDGSGEYIYTFTVDQDLVTEEQILKVCRENLPEYMVPVQVIRLKDFPLNSNGKIDKNELINILKENINR